MTDSPTLAAANHILQSIHNDLAFLKDNRFLTDRAYEDIRSLLPSRLSSDNGRPLQPQPLLPLQPQQPQQPQPQQQLQQQRPPLPTRRSNNSVRTSSTPMPTPVVTAAPPPRQVVPPNPMPSWPTGPTTTSLINGATASPSPPPAYDDPKVLCTAVAVYDYHGEDPSTDLSFRKGDRIRVTTYVNDDWWHGFLEHDRQKSGIFPHNHVEPAATMSEKTIMAPPYSYPPPPATLYQSTPAVVASPSMAQPVAPPDGEGSENNNKVKNMAQKFGGHVATAATWGFGATIGSQAANAIF